MSATSTDVTDVNANVNVNEVFLRGRLAVEPVSRELPSGDILTIFRITVPRPPGERIRVDSLECTSTVPRARRALDKAAAGDVLEVTGSLRRRFWRSPSGPASRYTVEVNRLKVIRAGRRGGASPARKQASG